MTIKNEYQQIQSRHQELLQKYESEGKSESLLSEALDFIGFARTHADVIEAVEERRQVRANLDFWAAAYHEVTGRYPNTRLQEINPIKVEIRKVERAISSQEKLRGIVSDDQLQTNLEMLENKRNDLVASLSGEKDENENEGNLQALQNEVHIIGEGNTVIHNFYDSRSLSDLQIQELLRHYLQTLTRVNNRFALKSISSSNYPENLTLESLYVELDVSISSQVKGISNHSENTVPLIEAVSRFPRLVLLGAPGSGKTTFVRYLSTRLARQILDGNQEQSLFERTFLPLTVSFRSLAPRLLSIDTSIDSRNALIDIVMKQWKQELENLGVGDLYETIRNEITQGNVFLIFDGLDELHKGQKEVAKSLISALIQRFPAIDRILITSRIAGFTGIEGFKTALIEPLSQNRIQEFLQKWNSVLEHNSILKSSGRGHELATILNSSSGIREFISNPLMLSIVISMYSFNAQIPAERVVFYEQAIDLLLYRWQRAKGLDYPASLRNVLGNSSAMRLIIERIAYESHVNGASMSSSGIDRWKLLSLLEDEHHLGDIGRADAFLSYVSNRTGLIVQSSSKTYTFIHRVFQEYLTGKFLLNHRRASREILRHLEMGEYWVSVIQLGLESLVFVKQDAWKALDIAYDLCPTLPPSTDLEWRATLVSAHIASLIDKRTVRSDYDAFGGGTRYLSRLEAYLEKYLNEANAHESEKPYVTRLLESVRTLSAA